MRHYQFNRAGTFVIKLYVPVVTFSTKDTAKLLQQLKSGFKRKMLTNVAGNSNDEINFLHKLLLTNTQIPKIRKAFGNN